MGGFDESFFRKFRETSGPSAHGTVDVGLPASEALEPSESEAEIVGVYLAHRNAVFRLALRYSAGDSAMAEDITQDVFVTLWRRYPSLEDRDDLGGWLYRVTTNRCLSYLRRERVRRSVLEVLGLGPKWVDPEPSATARADVARVLEIVRLLPPKERIAFGMRFLDGKSQNEIAELLGHSKGYISKLIHRATDRIRAAGWEVNP